MSQHPIIRPIDVLIGVKSIARRFSLSPSTVLRLMREDGCPVVKDRANVARCDAAEFWSWYKGKTSKH